MCRLFTFFVCTCVLAACSPRYYHGEQVAKTYSQESACDSIFFRRMVDRIVKEELQKQFDLSLWKEEQTVKETFSDPDSLGAQHLVERTTTTHSEQLHASAASSYSKDENNQEKIDSSKVSSLNSMEVKEEEIKVAKEEKGWLPWYIYVLALGAAVLLGIVLAHKRGWWTLRSCLI